MTYTNGTLTVKLGKLTLQERKTPKLQVRDDIAYGPGVLFEAKRTANRSFVGYGIMTIYPDRIHYYQQGIPPQEEPNSTEKEFIKTVIASIKSKVKSFIVVNTSLETGHRGPNGPGASSCQCSHYRPPPGVAPPPGPNKTPGGSHFLKDARYYAKYSNKPIVKYWAKLYLKYYDNKPATLGPPTQAPTTASTAPPTRGPPSIAPPTERPPASRGPIKPGNPTIGPPTLTSTH
ncbi:PREDICTED: uncharacterized protein LOC109590881 [Amphimedon queenslandica]|nr:PREDICTED: uncharacterized protein LOC109590881 [Amphimedon queenslandica]|eukprot:XP_019862291.1 PREDICTED: uncharacterized protein LOC109590881 [Amphimedon queenslandica]